MRKAWRTIAVIVAISAGILVLLGYFFDLYAWGLDAIRLVILRWAMILAAMALWVGAGNLVRVHGRKIFSHQAGSGYSLVTLVSLALTLAVVFFTGPDGMMTQWVFEHILLPIETSLMALLAIVLIYASVRMMRRRLNPFAIILFVTVIILLFGTTNWMGMEASRFSMLREWILAVPVTAGARGMLLGIALGIIATGVRILVGFDRPYEG
jgi:hypothetical protein